MKMINSSKRMRKEDSMKNGNDLGVALTATPSISEVKSMPAASKQKNFKSNGKGVEERSLGAQASMFATLMISVIASRYVDYYRAAVSWSPLHDWHYLLFALIVSFMAFPIVYKKAQQSRNDPIFVQLGLVFSAGIGWEKMLSSATDLFKP
jgi:hypothetical protein